MYHAPRGKGFFLLGLFSIFGPGKEGFSVKGLFWEEKKRIFWCSSMFLRLREGGNLPMEDWCYA